VGSISVLRDKLLLLTTWCTYHKKSLEGSRRSFSKEKIWKELTVIVDEEWGSYRCQQSGGTWSNLWQIWHQRRVDDEGWGINELFQEDLTIDQVLE